MNWLNMILWFGDCFLLGVFGPTIGLAITECLLLAFIFGVAFSLAGAFYA